MNIRYRSTWWRRMARKCGARAFRFAENNDDPRMARNGEGWLLREVLRAHGRERGSEPAIVMDVGANTGGYTRAVLDAAREAGVAVEVHAFEPSPHCGAMLQREFGHLPNVRVVAAALGDRVGEASLHHGKEGSSHASLVARPLLAEKPDSTISVPLRRLEDYLHEREVGRIALLKLDVEGFELAALRGAGDRLGPANVDVVQFEYGGTTMDAGATLRDLYALLGERGYVVAKLFPRAVEVRDYAPWMEQFAYANYVALAPRWVKAGRQ